MIIHYSNDKTLNALLYFVVLFREVSTQELG